MVVNEGNAANGFIEDGSDDAAVNNTGVALVNVWDCIVGMDFVTAVIIKRHIQTARVVSAAHKTKITVGLFIGVQGNNLFSSVRGPIIRQGPLAEKVTLGGVKRE